MTCIVAIEDPVTETVWIGGDSAMVDPSGDMCAVDRPKVFATAVADQGGDATQLLCAARDVEVAAYVEVDRGTATPELTARAKRLRAWLGQTGAIPRWQP